MVLVCRLRDIHVLTLMGHFSVVVRRVVSSPYGVLERSPGTQDVRGIVADIESARNNSRAVEIKVKDTK